MLENFAHTLQGVLEKNPALRLHVITTEVGDMLPVIKEVLTNVVVKYVKKMVPPWAIPGAIEFNAALRAKIGAHTVLVTNPRDMHAFIHDLKRHPFTAIIGVNTLYRALLDTPEFAGVACLEQT